MMLIEDLGRISFRQTIKKVLRPVLPLIYPLKRKLLRHPLSTYIYKHRLLKSSLLEARERDSLKKINSKISPNDTMYNGDLEHYYKVGLSAIRCINEVLRQAKVESVQNILYLPCGYGRELRFLIHRFPEAKITACDIDQPAVDFCSETFGTLAAYSSCEFDEILFDTRFDLIWCGSLITHLNSADTLDLLKLFHRYLVPGGVLIFTTHGNFVATRVQKQEETYGLTKENISILTTSYTENGYGYADYYPKQNGYGISITSPDWIRAQIQQLGGLQEAYFEERGWDNHHDVFGFFKQA